MSHLGADDLCWLSGFGGVQVSKVARWPARICTPDEGDDRVRKAQKPGRTLVKTYGDDLFVWAKPSSLSAFEGADEALQRAGPKVKLAIRAALDVRASKKPVQLHIRAPPEGLCDYERKRLETMRANQLVLEALGVAGASDSLRRASTPEKPALNPEQLAERAAKRAARLEEAHKNRRSSARLNESSDTGRTPKRYADEFAMEDDAERHVFLRLPKKRKKAAGRPAAFELSADERRAIAAAHDGASEWLEAMRRYFTDKLSEANLRSVMRKVTLLATGQGIEHTDGRRERFRQGQPVGLDEDLHALRAEANEWLRPEDDPGHGWRLDHPIGKMCLFQRHLHALSKSK